MSGLNEFKKCVNVRSQTFTHSFTSFDHRSRQWNATLIGKEAHYREETAMGAKTPRVATIRDE